ncbi:MAG: geranylgeranyl diphosphate synthase, type [Frankiaceae bacterium]|nr:geranylgeranyl diphosphate synthase, type [Frankiaceae bacterium]
MPASDASAELTFYAYHVREALLARLPRGGPAPEMYETLRVYPARTAGKALRPALLMATCAALGGDQDAALDLAVGVEMLHNAFLIHDDIQDRSLRRRGGPSLHVEYGEAAALWAGDAMAVEAMSTLTDAATRGGLPVATVLDEVQTAVRCALIGQAQELVWSKQSSPDVTASDYLAMVLRKTSWYSVILPCRLGSLAAGVVPLENRFVRFGTLLGAVLQLGDDVQGLLGTGDGDVAGGDLLEGKRSLPILYALEDGELAADLRHLLEEPAESRWSKTDEARELADRLENAAPLDRARRDVMDLAEQARAELALELVAAGPSAAATLLSDIIDYLSERCRGRSGREPGAAVTG